MIDFQTHFVFPVQAVAPCGPLPANAEPWELKAKDRTVLRGVHFKPAKPSDELILGFGGNAWNGQDVGEYLHELYPAAHDVAFHYRGYWPSEGTPSSAKLIADAPAIYDLAVERLKPKRIFAAGFSIGSGIACQLSAVRHLDGLVLVTPFDSLKAVAQDFYPWLPIAPFFAHEVDAASGIEKSKTPAAIIAAERDEIIPAERTDALRKRIPDVKFDRVIPSCGHNDLYSRSEFQLAMREALTTLGG